MEDFTAGNIQSQPSRRQSTLGEEWDERIRQLVADWGAEKSPGLIEEMIITALKMARDKMGTGDLKLMSRSFKEMRYAAKIFAAYRRFRKVCIFGSARTAPSDALAQVAEEFARAMVAENYMVIQRANDTIYGDAKLINFNYFFTRKLNFVKETHAFALFPGGFGTMDETFEVLTLMQTGKARIIPVVLLDRPNGEYWGTWMKFLTDHLSKLGFVSPEDFYFFKIAHNISEAVQEISDFYKVYHSARWVGDQLVIRLSHRLSKTAVAGLQT